MRTYPEYRQNESLLEVMRLPRGEERRVAWVGWLDVFYCADRNKREAMLAEGEPDRDGTVWDALLAGAVLWLSRKAELTPPAWCLDTSRRLSTFYFGGVKSRVLMQYQFWTTPLQFRYFNLLCGLGFVDRASMPPEWRPEPCRWELEWAERRAAERERRRSAAFRENVSQNTTSE